MLLHYVTTALRRLGVSTGNEQRVATLRQLDADRIHTSRSGIVFLKLRAELSGSNPDNRMGLGVVRVAPEDLQRHDHFLDGFALGGTSGQKLE